MILCTDTTRSEIRKMKTQQQMRAGKQSGFTLIELMIVVTIIGVLASIAVPVYRDYTIRTRVSEAASIFAPVKAEFALFYSENGTFPTALADMQRVAQIPVSYVGEYVSWLDLQPIGTFRHVYIGLKNDPRLGPDRPSVLSPIYPNGASQGVIVFTPDTSSGGTIRWRVSGRRIPTKYLPRP